MVEMRVGEEKVGIDLTLEGISEVAQAGAAVEDQQPLAAAHLDARGIAAVAHGARSEQAIEPRTPQKRRLKSEAMGPL